MERFLGQTLDLVKYVLIMILCDCLYKIPKICNTLPLISLCFNLITYTILGIIVFFVSFMLDSVCLKVHLTDFSQK